MVKVIPLKARMQSSSGIRALRMSRGRKPKWRRYVSIWLVAMAALIIGGAYVPKVTGPRSVATTTATDLRVIDGDTIYFKGNTYRLVGFDTPETNWRAKCDSERELGLRATARFRALISSGNLTLQEVRCSCAPGTVGTRFCNFGRLCGILRRNGENVGDILIREGLANPFYCGEFRCPRRLGWC